ncbi:MAG: SGNH/GDSL hydrolase family protein [Candidatus Hodarchaeota archaeon]
MRVNLKNEAVGGQSSEGGKQILKKALKKSKRFNFDLNIIAWGANDAGGKREPRKFEANIRKQVKMIRRKNPGAEFILVASSLPYKAWIHSQYELIMAYRDVLRTLSDEMGAHATLADMTSLWRDLLARKNYHDLTGNGLNHPNDWGHRLYAETIASLLLEQ